MPLNPETLSEYPFRWRTRQVRNPYKPPTRRAPITRYALVCNTCDKEVIAAAPGNPPGQRYFTYYANQAAIQHLEACGKLDT